MNNREGSFIEGQQEAREHLLRLMGYDPSRLPDRMDLFIAEAWVQKRANLDKYTCCLRIRSDAIGRNDWFVWLHGELDDAMQEGIASQQTIQWKEVIRQKLRDSICGVLGVNPLDGHNTINTRNFFTCVMHECTELHWSMNFGLSGVASLMPWNNAEFDCFDMVGLSKEPYEDHWSVYRLPAEIPYSIAQQENNALAEGDSPAEAPQIAVPDFLLDTVDVVNAPAPSVADEYRELLRELSITRVDPAPAERSQEEIEKAFDALLGKKAETKSKNWSSVFLNKK